MPNNTLHNIHIKASKIVKKREIFGWAMFDFANSGYTTVILTAIFNTYFISVVAGELEQGSATLLWTVTIAIANGLVLFASPLIGAISDVSCHKKRYLLITTIFCSLFTASLFFVGAGDILLACVLIILSSLMFFIGESIVAAFLPEISTPKNIGKISGYGWALGYIGGLIVLSFCLLYVNYAKALDQSAEEFVPVTMLIVAVCFLLAALPTFILLKERCVKLGVKPSVKTTIKPAIRTKKNLTGKLVNAPFKIKRLLTNSYQQIKSTWQHKQKHQDFFRFLLCLFVYYCGINTVVVIAAIYAQQVMHFTTQDTILLIIIVNISAAIGALVFGFIQDKLGVKNTLSLTLIIWIIAMLIAFFTSSVTWFWLVANLIGVALGSSQSAGRSLIGLFAPSQHNGEFFGLWGLAIRLAAIVGPMSYGITTYATQGDHKIALLSTTIFFIIGLLLLSTVNEKRGRLAGSSDENISKNMDSKTENPR